MLVPELLDVRRRRDVLVGVVVELDAVDRVDGCERRRKGLLRSGGGSIGTVEDLSGVAETALRLDERVHELLPTHAKGAPHLPEGWRADAVPSRIGRR